MERMEKLTYSEVVKEIRVIHMSPGGYEYIVQKDYRYPTRGPIANGKVEPVQVWDFFGHGRYDVKDYMLNYGYTKDRVKSMNKDRAEANKNLSHWKKGLRRLIKMAKQGPSTMNQMATSYTGNGPKTNIEYFRTLYRAISDSGLVVMGKEGKTPIFTHYANGSCECYFERN